jgi:NADH:ubiquinone oxidoreductase subunit C
MSVYPPPWTFSGNVVEISKYFRVIDCQGLSKVQILAVSNADYEINLNWSTDFGFNTDLQLTSGTQTGGITWHSGHSIKARFLNIQYRDITTVGNRTLRLQVSLNHNTYDLDSLINLGNGAKFYEREKGGNIPIFCALNLSIR